MRHQRDSRRGDVGPIEDFTDKELQLTAYEPTKDYIPQRDAKLKSRKSTRRTPSGKGPDDMVYGVDSRAKPPEQPPARAPSPQVEDPWLTSAADPWASPPGLPETPPDAAAWPPPAEGAWTYVGGDLDAFGKGKGKSKGKGHGDQPRPPLECHNWLGLGHPHRLCPTPVGQVKGKAGAEICENCRGKGHGKQSCTSKGGGRYTDPSFNEGAGQWAQGKGQGQWGQGKGGKGKGKGWGTGKGKGVYGVDDQAWEQDWTQQQAWAPPSEWPPNAAAAAFAAPRPCCGWTPHRPALKIPGRRGPVLRVEAGRQEYIASRLSLGRSLRWPWPSRSLQYRPTTGSTR